MPLYVIPYQFMYPPLGKYQDAQLASLRFVLASHQDILFLLEVVDAAGICGTAAAMPFPVFSVRYGQRGKTAQNDSTNQDV